MVKAMCTYQQQQQLMYIHASPWIGISCDESIDWSRGKHLVVFATFMKERAVVTEFLALLTIHKCNVGSLFAVLLSHLDNIGIDLQRIVTVSTDGAGVMIGSQSGLVVRLRQRVPHLVGTHCIAQRDAVARLCRILGAAIVVFIDYNHSMAVTVQTLNFQFCLYFLADLLAEINALNKFFQCRKVSVDSLCMYFFWLRHLILHEHLNVLFICPSVVRVDITLVHQEVDRTIGVIRLRYVKYVDIFGGGVSKLLSPFIARLGSGMRTIRVDSKDADGEPSSHQIVLSETPIPGHQYSDLMADCIKLCKAFAQEVATNMHTRMWSLKQMEGSKLYKVETWPEATDKRERRVLSWLDANARLFNNQLPRNYPHVDVVSYERVLFCFVFFRLFLLTNVVPPSHVAGFNHRAAELELASFCHVMSRHYQDDDFYHGLAKMLRTKDWPRSFPNMTSMWQALAVIPLSNAVFPTRISSLLLPLQPLLLQLQPCWCSCTPCCCLYSHCCCRYSPCCCRPSPCYCSYSPAGAATALAAAATALAAAATALAAVAPAPVTAATALLVQLQPLLLSLQPLLLPPQPLLLQLQPCWCIYSPCCCRYSPCCCRYSPCCCRSSPCYCSYSPTGAATALAAAATAPAATAPASVTAATALLVQLNPLLLPLQPLLLPLQPLLLPPQPLLLQLQPYWCSYSPCCCCYSPCCCRYSPCCYRSSLCYSSYSPAGAAKPLAASATALAAAATAPAAATPTPVTAATALLVQLQPLLLPP
ncbi:unnamed protein product [Closterium sp. NIES-54]